ncbi:Wzz/FepE/Etk N-terminal domain-containing protein [Propionivibrio sp.]|uniref:Wzz/FepE/Etk N-terminal domain-containing protein n=1 Tax=Propionivibrio sp. TaxID=2212460 RepID=UPI003BF34BC3
MNPNDSHAAEDYHDDEINLFELWGTLVQNKWIIVMIAALCVSAAAVVAFTMTPKYEAVVLAKFTEESKTLAGEYGGLAEMAGVNLGGGGGTKDASLAYLKSRVFIEGFIKANDLMPILYAKQWDSQNKKWLVDDPEKTPSLWNAFKFFSSICVVQHDKKTNLITVTVTWKDREQAVDWANSLIKRANANLREKAIAESQLSVDYLEKELRKTSVVEVQQTIYKVMETQIKMMMMANTQEQFAFKVIDPAALVDENAYVKPKRSMIITLGAVCGLILGLLFVFIRQAIRNRRQRVAVL